MSQLRLRHCKSLRMRRMCHRLSPTPAHHPASSTLCCPACPLATRTLDGAALPLSAVLSPRPPPHSPPTRPGCSIASGAGALGTHACPCHWSSLGNGRRIVLFNGPLAGHDVPPLQAGWREVDVLHGSLRGYREVGRVCWCAASDHHPDGERRCEHQS